MALYGCKYPCFKPDNAETGVVLGAMVSANSSYTKASGKLYADNRPVNSNDQFIEGTVTMELDDMDNNAASVIFGAKKEGNKISYNTADYAPYGNLAFYKTGEKRETGEPYFEGTCYKHARASVGDESVQTKGNSINYQTKKVAFTIIEDNAGYYVENESFADEASAIAWVKSKTGIGTAYKIGVSVQNAESGKGVDKVGDFYVAAGEDFVLNIEGYASVQNAFDNGENVKTAITGGDGTYTVSAVAEDHNIVIIF